MLRSGMIVLSPIWGFRIRLIYRLHGSMVYHSRRLTLLQSRLKTRNKATAYQQRVFEILRLPLLQGQLDLAGRLLGGICIATEVPLDCV